MRTLVSVVALLISLAACGDSELAYQGNLDGSDSRLTIDGSPYDWFTLELAKGDRIAASAASEAFEPTLFLFNPDHKQIMEQQGTQGLAIVNYEVNTPGTYAVMVNAQKSGAAGPYTLSVQFTEP